ncbi:MAG: hypothetical protein IPJ84_05035 [Bdellovibrionales bacterium]|nr:hypothetical protein [Bdellovibrionales bacterium]
MLNRAITDSTLTAQTEALEVESDMKFIKKLNGSEAPAPVASTNSGQQKPEAKSDSTGKSAHAANERRPGGGCIPVSGFDR